MLTPEKDSKSCLDISRKCQVLLSIERVLAVFKHNYDFAIMVKRFAITKRNFTFYIKKIILSGDVETNPGPESKLCQEFPICHWNLSSIATHSFIKVSLLKAYITIYNYNAICLSETYPDSSILSDDKILEIPGYDLIWADHLSNSKQGGVCVYYRNLLPLKILNIFYLQECIVFELKIGNKFCKIVSLYRSPNQSQDEFETFTNNLELILDKIFETNSFLVIVLGDFNRKISGIKMTKQQVKVPK